jgi:hypothetical protein
MPEFDLNQLLGGKPSEIPDVTAIRRVAFATD